MSRVFALLAALVLLVLVSANVALAEKRVALVIESLHEADDATVQELREVLGREGWLRLPLVLGVAEIPEDGPLAELLAAVDGEPITVQVPEQGSEVDWSALSPELLLTMRAAAIVGRSFDAELVAGLLGVGIDEVLVRLQQAHDQGVPLSDHGGGRLQIPEGAQRSLVQRILPSLVERWHRRLGEILGAAASPESALPEAASEEAAAAISDETAEEQTEGADDESSPAVSASYEEVLEPAGEDRLAAPPREPEAAEPEAAEPEAAGDSPPKTIRLAPGEAQRLLAEEAAKRSPAEAAAMGMPERAVEQYLAALRKVASRGDSRRALRIAEQALTLLSRQRPSRGRDLLRARVLAMAARVQWRGVGRGPALSLQGALETLDEALELLPPDPPLDLFTELAQLVAGVCYDLGDIGSLQRALDALTDAARALMAAGESVRAARLLNDQAAVYLRAGDPVRANHLLQQSRTIFDDLHRERPDDPTVIVERAETEHVEHGTPVPGCQLCPEPVLSGDTTTPTTPVTAEEPTGSVSMFAPVTAPADLGTPTPMPAPAPAGAVRARRVR